jgi:hypothetical protein
MNGFKDFFNEVSTTTASVATFARPFLGGTVDRTFPDTIASRTNGTKKKNKKNLYMQPQVIESDDPNANFPPPLAFYHQKTYKDKKVGINPFGTLGEKGDWTVAKQQPEITNSNGDMIKRKKGK